ncbi:MAG: hypothetical protein ABSG13_25630 [Bryobacteraceae bacterium]|jgi:hypothetical protein
MAAHADLWGEIAPSAVRTPVSILREQAALLGVKTNHLVEGQVETQISGRTFYHSFNLVVPALENYSYELFKIYHGVNIYPVHVGPQIDALANEEAFVTWLGQKLSSPETKRIIGNLLAQANS